MAANSPTQIGSVSTRTGLSVDAIRFYERQQLLEPPPRSGGGFRLFGEKEVETLLFIKSAQEMGFSLDEIRDLVSLRRDTSRVCPRVQKLIETRLAAVQRKIADLRRLEVELESSLRKCNATLLKQRRGKLATCPALGDISSRHPREKRS